MKRVDRLVIGELFGPWAFGVAIFTVLIMAGSFLFELTRYLSEGVSPAVVAQLTVLLLPGIMAKTFPMAVLLATLLSFGRLSGDSEIVALKAAGISVERMMVPVGVFGALVFLLSFGFNELVVPGASVRAAEMKDAINTELDGKRDKSTEYPIFEDGRLVGLVAARNFSFTEGTLDHAVIVTYGEDGRPTSYLYAPKMVFRGERDWRLSEGSTMTPVDGGILVRFKGDAVPDGVAQPSMTPEDLLAETLRDLDALSMKQMGEQLERQRLSGEAGDAQLANLEFGYWNKIAVPLAALVFGLVGAPLGIRNHRTGVASGFWLSVLIIFGYMLLANAMSIYAQGGRVPPIFASFAPILVGLVVAVVLIRRKNV